MSGKEKMKPERALKLVSAGAGLAIVVGTGWIVATGDWLVGGILLILGFANLVRMGQLWRRQ